MERESLIKYKKIFLKDALYQSVAFVVFFMLVSILFLTNRGFATSESDNTSDSAHIIYPGFLTAPSIGFPVTEFRLHQNQTIQQNDYSKNQLNNYYLAQLSYWDETIFMNKNDLNTSGETILVSPAIIDYSRIQLNALIPPVNVNANDTFVPPHKNENKKPQIKSIVNTENKQIKQPKTPSQILDHAVNLKGFKEAQSIGIDKNGFTLGN